MLSNMGDLYCGGVIGKDGQMRILIPWTVAGHRANKLLCITCASVGGSGKPSLVFVEPTIPLQKLSPTILTMQQSVGDWKMLFLSVRNQPDITTNEIDELAERSSTSVPVHMRTECDVFSRYNTATAACGTPRS
jgi:hypothetical protein